VGLEVSIIARQGTSLNGVCVSGMEWPNFGVSQLMIDWHLQGMPKRVSDTVEG
jgi:hypothetical protein